MPDTAKQAAATTRSATPNGERARTAPSSPLAYPALLDTAATTSEPPIAVSAPPVVWAPVESGA